MKNGYMRAVTALVAITIVACVGREQASPRTLRGVWGGSSVQGQGMTFAFDGNGHALWTISGQQGRTVEVRYAVDFRSTPHRIDIRGLPNGPLAGRRLHGILEFIDDSTFRLEMEGARPGLDPETVRPNRFTSNAMVFTRTRPPTERLDL